MCTCWRYIQGIFFLNKKYFKNNDKNQQFYCFEAYSFSKNSFLYLAYNKSKNVFFFLPKKGLSVTKHIVFKMCFEIFYLLASSKNVIINQLLSLLYR